MEEIANLPDHSFAALLEAILSSNEHAMQSLSITLDTTVYRITAIKKTAYKFGGRCGIQIRQLNSQVTEVQFEAAVTVDLQMLKHEFLREVTDQELREVVQEETSGIRNLLLAQAFSSTSLIQGDLDVVDYSLDPQLIGRPDVTQP